MSSIDKAAAAMARFASLDKAARDARKKARQEQRKERSLAVEADNWQPRDGKDRPTPERKAKGKFELIDGEDAGVTIAIDRQATVLDQLQAAGHLTPEQCEAGLDFAALMARTRLVSQGRSCLDFTPVGYEGDIEDEASKADEAARAKIFARCNGPWVWAELRRVCCENRPVSHLASLQDGLDICAKILGR